MHATAEPKPTRPLICLLPFGVAVLLLLLGLQVSYTAFAWGAMPIAGWRTEAKGFFGLVWLGVFGVVLLPAYLHAIESSLTCLRSPEPAAAGPARRLLAALGVTILLVALTLAARVAVTAWFPVPMHPPFQRWTGGVGPGLIATVLLLALEVAVLRGIKHQTRRDQKPYPLLIPAAFGALLLGWALWVVWSAFARGRFPVIPWQTEHRSWFGLLWLVATLTVLMPAYVYAMSLGVLGLVRRFYSQDVTQQNLWLVAITTTAMLFVLTLAARVAVTAWFPGPIHPPFEFLNGNLLMGLGASLILALLSALYYRVARAF